MEVLDTTVALVALRYIAGGLSAASDDAEWVITSYLAANAFILPITGWLSSHLGRRNYFLASIAIFTLSSLMCGLAGSLGQLILFRVIQGLAGGGLQPGSQAILLDAFPRERQGVAMTLFGFAVLIAPVVGPTLGGWITDTYNWRWVFLINVPFGTVALGACYAVLRDPDYLVVQRAELRKQPFHFDAIGLSLLAIVIVSWEVVLSKGQEWDWLGDPFWRVQTLVISFGVGLVALIFWELRHRNPVVSRIDVIQSFPARTAASEFALPIKRREVARKYERARKLGWTRRQPLRKRDQISQYRRYHPPSTGTVSPKKQI